MQALIGIVCLVVFASVAMWQGKYDQAASYIAAMMVVSALAEWPSHD